MSSLLNAVLVVVLVMNLFLLGTSRILAVIRTVAAQGVLLGIISLLVHEHLTLPAVAVAVGTIFLKGIAIPAVMIRALRDAQIRREVEPLIGLLPSIILGALATAFALLFSAQLPLAGRHADALLAPTSFATVLVGFILLTTRFKALNQVVGYLVLENGIFIFGMLLIEAMPLVVETGVLLDLFVGIFVICIIVNHINRAFASMDTRRLISLKE
ncbi:MAG TPA: hydrogenase [Candidatus Dormibacteraeota bacterium]|nr:hydrogenase [Candidatus Dormibacteraeota bacterium]